MQERKKIKISTKNLKIGFVGLEFSKRILSKYTFIRKSGRLPALIFLKLFSNKIESRKIKPYPNSKSIINYFRFHLSFYFGIVRKSMGISGGNPIEHMSYIIEFVEPHQQLSESELKLGLNSVKKMGSKYSTGSLEKKKALEFLKFKISGRSEISTSIRSQYVLNNSTAGKQLNFSFFPEFSYLDMFHQMMLHMHYKPMNNYGNLLVSRNKEIKDINYFQAPGSDRHDSSYHFSYLMTGPAKIALSPATSGYLQGNRHIENKGSIRYNDASPVVLRKMNKELSFSGSLPVKLARGYSAKDNSDAVKTNNLPIMKDGKIPDLRNEHTPGSYLHSSSHHFSYLMKGPAKIALSPAASGYLQRNSHIENKGSIRYNDASPVVLRKMNKDISFSGSLPVKPAKVYSAVDDSAAVKTNNLPMNQKMIINDIRNEHTPGSYLHSSPYHFSYLLTGHAKIALSNAASGYLQRNSHIENTGYENISIVRLNGQNKNLNFRNLTGNNTYNPSELVIKKTSLRETENVARNTQEKTTSTRINDHSIKDSIGERPINEINRIADRVYHIIERKISIEKDRRGLL